MKLFLLLVFLTLYSSWVSAADLECGDPPAVINERVKGEVEVKANAISKLLGALGFGAAYEETRKDIFSRYGESNAARADQYLYFFLCTIVNESTTLTDEQKIEAIFKMGSMSGAPIPSPRPGAETGPSNRPPPSGAPPQGSAPGGPIVIASRIFAGPNEYPPKEFAANGILAFRSRPSPYDRERHFMFCNAYVAILPPASELQVPRSKQMVTVWPLSSDDASDRLNRLRNHTKDICQIAVDDYGLVIAQQALKDAELTGRTLSRAGPFLLAWSPSADKGKQDALVLVSDLSDITTYEQAHEMFVAWSRDKRPCLMDERLETSSD